MVYSGWETSVGQSSVLISEVQKNSLRHRRPSCFTIHSTACFTTDLARHRTHRSSKPHILCRRSIWLSWLVFIFKDGSDCDSLSPSAQMRVFHSPPCYKYPQQNSQSLITHNESMRYPLLDMCQNRGNNNKGEMALYLLLFQWIKLFYDREAIHTGTFADQMGV